MAKEVKEIVTTNEDKKCQQPMEEKIILAKSVVLDKIISGLGNGSNIEHCLTLSNIYKNLCN